MIKRKAAALAVLAGLSAPALAQSGWAQVGHSTAAGSQDKTMMTPTLDPRYREGMICVDGHVIRLTEATLHFEGGTSRSVRLGARVTDGGCSRSFTFGSRSRIERIEVGYDPATLNGNSAQVQLYAR